MIIPKFNMVNFAVLILRLAFGFRLVYGTIDNIVSYDQMLEFRDFLQQYGFPFPLFCAFVSVILQFLAGLSWIVGYKVRLSSILMIFNFAIAIVAVHLNDSYLGASAAIHQLVVAFFLFSYGSGSYGIDRVFIKVQNNNQTI